ncbi:helix-turn-helix domain-containing protein [Gordonia sp. w5E2]|uniref:AraC family transcriptional regulator n=1 Tax=Gordonia jacobaea TaxID=122202 RepID=A0ABR5I7Z2_9ACTN|nr:MULTISPECIES: helix-turn-helix domain-containing protein [Gordonia]KNA89774.1 AraC family transcriptional regulator [Gordonia jacobaea]OBC03537.1 AraC family transcriptional regulator [Gordonia sp. 852002-50395_SCH5434458]OBC16557.1 AraC family transcriptional regulator [Gordonia sp. 852002-50816_SCH5313054-a]OBC20389.1 AraC family transcriptional regulator [Gordonia sp. 852002-50816_SCH5313054-c]
MLSKVAAILHGNVALFEFGVLNEVFGLDRTDLGGPPFDFRVCAPDPSEPLSIGNGASIVATHGLDAARDVDLVAIPGGSTSGDYPEEILDTLRAVVDNGGRVLTVCSGAFVAGAAGLLDGRRCTTHWAYGEKLAHMFPAARVDTDVLFVDDGPVTTSAGTAAGIDAALHLVREEIGHEAANLIARRMVVPPHRDGGQRQFVDTPIPECGSKGFAEMLDWLVENLDREVRVDEMAARMHMSPRTFARRFGDEVGVSPHKWLTEQRVAHARRLLETTSLPMEQIATQAGFGSATLLRHHFASAVGVSPATYRRRFAAQQAG